MQRLSPDGRTGLGHRGVRTPENQNPFPEDRPNIEAREDIKITDTAPLVRTAEGERAMGELVQRRWSWPSPAKKPVYNFRSEGREFGSNRCLIVADGFYEWTKADDGGKDPWLIQMPGGAPYAFAGLWAHNTRMETPVTSCTIITGPSIAPISQIHDRMPIILDPGVFDAWLNPATPAETLKGILAHHLDGQMQMHRVSREVNKSTFEGRPEPIVNSL